MRKFSKRSAYCSVLLLGVFLTVARATVCTAQLVRTEVIPIGKISQLYGTGSIEVTVEVPHSAGSGGKVLAIRVVASLNEYETSLAKFSSGEVASLISNLQEMINESAKTPDYLEYHLAAKKFVASIQGGPKSQFGLTLGIATAGTADRTEADNRQILKDFVDLLKRGQHAALAADKVPEAEPSLQPPERLSTDSEKQIVRANSEAGKSSPAAAAAMIDVGHLTTPEEMAVQVKAGQASRCAVITNPPGAEIDIDGNKAGLSPMAFVLLRRGDTPRVITIKLSGYKTVETKVVPDGRTIPLGLTLEREPQ